MSGWLSRASSLFQQAVPVPEPFEVECDCGGKVVGQRTATHQRPICHVCERPVFVLPANVYPKPTPKPTPKQSSQPKSIKQGDVTVRSRTPKNVVADVSSPTPSSVSPAIQKLAQGRKVEAKPVAEPLLPAEPRSPLISPLRLISTAIVLISSLTAGGLWYRHRIENAKAIVAISADAGMAAIREHDFVKAAHELDRARLAVDTLGRTDQAAKDIRRFAREASALARLASNSLTEFLQETLTNSTPGQTEPLKMASLDKNAWVLFDATIFPSDEGKDRLVIDAPILLRKNVVRIEIESATLRRASQSAESSDVPRVIFAAQLDQVSPLRGKPPTSVLTLNGKSAFLWTSYETYASVGYRPVDEEEERQTKAILQRQLESQP